MKTFDIEELKSICKQDDNKLFSHVYKWDDDVPQRELKPNETAYGIGLAVSIYYKLLKDKFYTCSGVPAYIIIVDEDEKKIIDIYFSNEIGQFSLYVYQASTTFPSSNIKTPGDRLSYYFFGRNYDKHEGEPVSDNLIKLFKSQSILLAKKKLLMILEKFFDIHFDI